MLKAKQGLVKFENSDTVCEGVSQARLPKLELPTFSGDFTEWTGFWEQFQVSVDKTNLNAVTKFTYLRSLLSGEAAAAITRLTLSATNYETALNILKERFGRHDRIKFSHSQALLNISVPEKPRVDALWTLYNTIQAHVRSLEVLGIGGGAVWRNPHPPHLVPFPASSAYGMGARGAKVRGEAP